MNVTIKQIEDIKPKWFFLYGIIKSNELIKYYVTRLIIDFPEEERNFLLSEYEKYKKDKIDPRKNNNLTLTPNYESEDGPAYQGTAFFIAEYRNDSTDRSHLPRFHYAYTRRYTDSMSLFSLICNKEVIYCVDTDPTSVERSHDRALMAAKNASSALRTAIATQYRKSELSGRDLSRSTKGHLEQYPFPDAAEMGFDMWMILTLE